MCTLLIAAAVPPHNAHTRLTLDAARAKLAEVATQGGALGPISLDAYNFHLEIPLGHHLTAIAVSCQYSGGIALFDESNELVSTVETRDIEWVQVLDMDGDGVAELITQELGALGESSFGWS